MQWSISNLICSGSGLSVLRSVPHHIGVEIFSEFGNTSYWKMVLPSILEGRSGAFSIHGPFHGFNLAAADCNFAFVLKGYQDGFEICQHFGAQHCVCHTHTTNPVYPAGFSVADGQQRAMERIAVLAEHAKPYGVTLLIENLPAPSELFAQEAYQDCLHQLPETDALVDIGHALILGWDLPGLLQNLGSRIRAFHVHDNNGKQDQHLLPGQGILDWTEFFAAYQAHTPPCRDGAGNYEYNHSAGAGKHAICSSGPIGCLLSVIC